MHTETLHLEAVVPETCSGKRLDQTLALLYPEHSRARLAEWIREGSVCLNGSAHWRPKDKVKGGEGIQIQVTLSKKESYLPQDIPLNIHYEDEAVLIINKAAGQVVHPGAGNPPAQPQWRHRA